MKQATGNIWTWPADATVITTNGTRKTTNGACVMGAGTAKQARDHFPNLDFYLGRLIGEYGNRTFHLGIWAWHRVWPFKEPPLPLEAYRLVAFPVKHHWKEQADPDLIEKSARELVSMTDKFGWTSVVMPRPGCGNGHLPWSLVEGIIEPILDDRFTVLELA